VIDPRLLLSAAPDPARAWVDGDRVHVRLGPGLRAAIAVTSAGEVLLTSVGGDLRVTEGAGGLAEVLHRADRAAAEVRGELAGRGRGGRRR
jgi:hypothetical protein